MSLLSISVVTNFIALAVFGVVRWLLPENTPNVGELLQSGSEYFPANFPYLILWGSGLLLLSTALAYGLATARHAEWLNKRLSPVIVNSSAWFEAFEDAPLSPHGEKWFPYVACYLSDGSYVAGRLSWYSTEIEETADRDIALAEPIVVQDSSGVQTDTASSSAIISARQLRWLTITWVNELYAADSAAEPSSPAASTDSASVQESGSSDSSRPKRGRSLYLNYQRNS